MEHLTSTWPWELHFTSCSANALNHHLCLSSHTVELHRTYLEKINFCFYKILLLLYSRWALIEKNALFFMYCTIFLSSSLTATETECKTTDLNISIVIVVKKAKVAKSIAHSLQRSVFCFIVFYLLMAHNSGKQSRKRCFQEFHGSSYGYFSRLV